MKANDLWNVAALFAAVTASMLGPGLLAERHDVRVEQIKPQAPAMPREIALPDGTRGVRDASGTIVVRKHYVRIASASIIADELLWSLCEPERIVAVTRRSKESLHFGFRYGTRPGLDSNADLETILALHADLVIVNRFGDPRYAAQLREHGIAVFDLGEMHGIDTLLPSIAAIGALVGAEARAAELSQQFVARLEAVAADVPKSARPNALFLSTYGKQLYGGAAGTSYDDVLRYGGLRDAATPRYRGWPAFEAEQVLALDPDVLVTRGAMRAEVCRYPGLENLRACAPGARIAVLDDDLADDPGLPMLELAESLREQIHGARRR